MGWISDAERREFDKLQQLKLELDQAEAKLENFRQETRTRLDRIDVKLEKVLNKLNKILKDVEPSAQHATGFKANLSVTLIKEMSMSPLKAAAPAPDLEINDDGSATITLTFTDEDGVPIVGLTALPPGVAVPVFASSDQNPGPSAFVITPDPSGLKAAVVPVQPPADPNNLAQKVDFTVTIASGLFNQTAPVTEDAGTLSIVADASKVGGFAAVISEP